MQQYTINPLGFPSDGHDDRGWQLYLASLIMILVAGIFVIGRCAGRLALKRFGPDDYAITVALIFSIGLSVTIQLAVKNGYGMHVKDLTDEQASTALRWFYIAQPLYKVTVCLYKVSALLLYRRIFTSRPFKIMSGVIMAIIVCWSFAAIFGTIFQCVPVESAWNPTIQPHCINKAAFWIAYAVADVLTDVLVLSLPIPQVMKLHMKLRDRIYLCGIFMLGGFVTVTSILRTTVVTNSVENLSDITYNFIPRGIWTLIEANLGIICACLPVLGQPLARLFPRFFGNSAAGQSGYSAGQSYGKRWKQPSYGHSAVSDADASGTHQIELGQKDRTTTSIIALRSRRDSDTERIIAPNLSRQYETSESLASDFGKKGIEKEVCVSVHSEA